MPRLRLLALGFTLLLVAPAALPPAVAEGEAHPVFVPLLQTDLPPTSFFATPEGVLVAVPAKDGGLLYLVNAEGAVLLPDQVGYSVARTSEGAIITDRNYLTMYQGEGFSTNLSYPPWQNLAFGPEGHLYGVVWGSYLPEVRSMSEAREVRSFGRADTFAFSSDALHLRRGANIVSVDPSTGETLAQTRINGTGQLLAFDATGHGYYDSRTSAGTEIRRFTPGVNGSELLVRAAGRVDILGMAFAGSDLVVARCIQWTCEVGYYPDIAEGFVGHPSSFRPIRVGDLVVSDLRMNGSTVTVEVTNKGEHATLAGSMLQVERYMRQPLGLGPGLPDHRLASATLPALASGEKLRLTIHRVDNMTDGMVLANIFTASYASSVVEEEDLGNNRRELRTRGRAPTGGEVVRL